MFFRSELGACVTRIRDEIKLFRKNWDLNENPGDNGTSTCGLKLGHPLRPQLSRRYDIKINKSNLFDGKEPDGVEHNDLVDVCKIHEQTHAVCDLSYTCNRELSKLGTWNAASNDYRQADGDPAATEKLLQLWALDAFVTGDQDISPDVKEYFRDRLGYGLNLIDVDPVINELCVLAYYLKLPRHYQTVQKLVEFALRNLNDRHAGRFTRR